MIKCRIKILLKKYKKLIKINKKNSKIKKI